MNQFNRVYDRWKHKKVTQKGANRFLEDKFVGEFNRCFMAIPAEEGSVFVPLRGSVEWEVMAAKVN